PRPRIGTLSTTHCSRANPAPSARSTTTGCWCGAATEPCAFCRCSPRARGASHRRTGSADAACRSVTVSTMEREPAIFLGMTRPEGPDRDIAPDMHARDLESARAAEAIAEAIAGAVAEVGKDANPKSARVRPIYQGPR